MGRFVCNTWLTQYAVQYNNGTVQYSVGAVGDVERARIGSELLIRRNKKNDSLLMCVRFDGV